MIIEGENNLITVSILINAQPIFTRTAVNVTPEGAIGGVYELDTGEIIAHNPDDGAVALAKKMLDTIVER